jgi:hypothetical protein
MLKTTSPKTSWLDTIKAGDSIWIGIHADDHRRIEKVSRLTETQIVTGVNFGASRYQRKNGRPIGGRTYWITGIATEKDIQEYNAKLAAQREESKHRAEAEKQIEAKRKELDTLFNGVAFVRPDNDKWVVEFEPANESAVRALAELATGLEVTQGS